MQLIEVDAVPAPRADRDVLVPRQRSSDELRPGEPVVLHAACGDYFSGQVVEPLEGSQEHRIVVGGRLPEDLALRRVGKVVDLSPEARREAASLQQLADLLGAAGSAVAPVVPVQRAASRPRQEPTG